MLLLYAIPIGLAVGLLGGGRLDGLANFRLRWAPLVIAGLIVQVALFSEAGGRLAGGLLPAIYVASTAAVLVGVLRNIRFPGIAVAVGGGLANLAAIVANGGSMPAAPEALAAAGITAPPGYTNSVILAHPALQPLTDVFAVPAGVPLANVFSIGDVIIGLGVVMAIAAAMRRDPLAADSTIVSAPIAPPGPGS